jgi:hypothetical protein
MSTEKVMTMVPEDLALSSDIEYPTGLGTASLPAGAELMREFLANSPFVGHLGMRPRGHPPRRGSRFDALPAGARHRG